MFGSLAKLKKPTHFSHSTPHLQAKICGSYAALVSGSLSDGFSSLTGAPCLQLNVQDCEDDSQVQKSLPPDELWPLLASYHSSGFLMGASTSRSVG